MRKATIFVIILTLAVSLIACTQGNEESGIDESSATPSSFSEGKSEETPTVSEEVTTTSEAVTEIAVETEQSTTAAVTDNSKQASGDKSVTKPKTEEKQPVVTTPKPTEKPKPTEPPKSDPPPKPKTAYEKPYDTGTIIADAKTYGESIGMAWSAPLTKDNCAWEAPIQTSSVLQGERLKTAIESGIRRVKKLQQDNEYQPGEFHFKLYLESIGNGEYSLYFLMG
jgi:hypothetical protein